MVGSGCGAQWGQHAGAAAKVPDTVRSSRCTPLAGEVYQRMVSLYGIITKGCIVFHNQLPFSIVMAFVVLLPHLTALVAGTSAVSSPPPDSVHSVLMSPTPTLRAPKCDRIIVSSPGGPKNGTFSSPNMENPEGHARQCVYTFIATENERVQVTFTDFDLRGTPPECSHEYIDLYTEIEEPSTDLISTPFGGRYCGRLLPRKRISMHQMLVVSFYTDEKTVDEQVFQGTYEFIDASQFIIGTSAPKSVCSFTIYSDQKREGQLYSPTYPGVYPKNLQCQYRFLGKNGQRVRLEFMDFDLFYGGSHCPFDFVKIYDGGSNEDPLIGTYCGQQRYLVVYSSAENLFVQFNTRQRTADSQNRGFAAWYEFSERFVNLGFIGKNDGEHIRGTECDQKILSKRESNGTVYSPNYPYLYHSHTVCRYYIYGLQDAQHLERVRLEFELFDIPSTDPECTDGYLKLYLQGQEERQAVDEYDHIFCGSGLPQPLMSEGPRLVMVFSSGSSQGQGFKSRYIFETDYKIPGTPAPDGTCNFTYVSTDDHVVGEFNSPRYPSNYPSSTHCEYKFLGRPGEQVKIVFNYFKTKADPAGVGYNEACHEDWMEVYEIFPSGRERKMGRYCAKTSPGPLISDVGVNSMRVVLQTDDAGVASGFIATYTFIKAMGKFGDCGRNISGEENGSITSPGYPQNYASHRQVCHWYITVRPGYRVLLLFTYFLVEGDPEERGCPGAVVRVWKDLSQPPMELCGDREKLANESKEIISSSNLLKISFVTADKAVGSGGFKATWTEIKEGHGCKEFHCKLNDFCVAPDLKCNGLPNCGLYDDSDEYNCGESASINVYLVVGLALSFGVFAVLTICLVCHRKRRRRRSLPPNYEHRQKPPREVPGLHFMSVDSV